MQSPSNQNQPRGESVVTASKVERQGTVSQQEKNKHGWLYKSLFIFLDLTHWTPRRERNWGWVCQRQTLPPTLTFQEGMFPGKQRAEKLRSASHLDVL